MAEEIKKERSSLRRKVTLLLKKLDEKNGATLRDTMMATSLSELGTLLARIESLDERLCPLQSEEDSDIDYEALLLLKAKRTEYQQGLLDVDRAEARSTASAITAVPGPMPKLMHIEPYNGDPLKWASFWDAFSHSVHQVDVLPPVQKFTYLRSLLTGEAARSIEGWSTTSANYDSAVEYLHSWFGNPEDQKQALWSRLLAIEPVKTFAIGPMRLLLDTAQSTTSALEALGIPLSSYTAMLMVLLRQRLPPSLDEQWLLSSGSNDSASVSHLLAFLEAKVRAREQSSLTGSGQHRTSTVQPSRTSFTKPRPTTMYAVQSHSPRCCFCDGNHILWNCSLTVEQKRQVIRDSGLCFNCLRKGHNAAACPSSQRCKICQRNHHTSIHKSEQSTSTVAQATLVHQPLSPVVLPVVLIPIQGGKRCFARCLLDTGSSATFISESLCNRIKPKHLKDTKVELFTFANGKKVLNARIVSCEVGESGSSFPIQPVVLPDLGVKQPALTMDSPCVRELREMHGITLQDSMSESPVIDMIIGSDLYPMVVKTGRMPLSGGAVGIETVFGWAIHGPVGGVGNCPSTIVNFVKTSTCSLEEQVAAFWEIEEPKPSTPMISDDTTFDQLIHHDGERYVVPLLWKGTQRPTPNKGYAYHQFDQFKKQTTSSGMWPDYQKVFQEYEEFGAIESDLDPHSGDAYFLPHHPVIKPESDTHKLRIVFNASSKSKNGISLNDCLDSGPNLLPHIICILLRFRHGSVPLTGDLKKAFFAIAVSESDRQYLKLAYDQPKRLCRVPFGVNCSPYLLQATIIHHLKGLVKTGSISPELYQKVQESLYMDDLISSFSSSEQCKLFMNEVTQIFDKAGMTVHKWQGLDPGNSKARSSVVGMCWDRAHDSLSISENTAWYGEVRTKRQLLSALSSIFDPLGLVSPFTLLGKILVQSLWRVPNLDWDDPLPSQLQEQVNTWINGLRTVPVISFPRTFLAGDFDQLHIFVDASETGYGAIAYVISMEVHLLCSKTKVAPLKSVTLPRLELQAAVLGIRLFQTIQGSLKVNKTQTYFWSDSKVALSWIKSNDPRKWNTFVANRVAEINRQTTIDQWHFVPGSHNPADLASRGVSDTVALRADTVWQIGPPWLRSEAHWPVKNDTFATDEEEKRAATCITIISETPVDLFPRLSSWSMMTRVIALILRWRKHTEKPSGPLTAEELKLAEKCLIKLVQRQFFKPPPNLPSSSQCPVQLQQSSSCASMSKSRAQTTSSGNHDIIKWKELKGLDPFVDSDGIIRVGGRLHFSDLLYHSKHPAILPYYHRYSDCLVNDAHKTLLHAGVDLMVTHLRQKFWILKARRLCRNVRTRCVTCKRFESPMPVFDPPFAPLPADRVNLSYPFAACGTDYAGPFKIKTKPDNSVSKVYILIFVCCSTRAIYIALVDSLSTSDFLNAFSIFTSRFNVPKLIRSDNAKTFRKAALTLTNIQWKFIPPHSPWWGGFYERFVQMIKSPLRKHLLGGLVTRQELQCILARIERTINSRPLTKPSTDPKDHNPVTPLGLLGQTFNPMDDGIELNAREMTKRQRHLMRMTRLMQRHWRNEYLSALNIRSQKGGSKLSDLSIGDLVYVNNGGPRYGWPLARILKLLPGPDGVTRLVKVCCGSNEFLRSIQKLLPLELGLVDELPSHSAEIESPKEGCPAKQQTQHVTQSGRTVKPRIILDL